MNWVAINNVKNKINDSPNPNCKNMIGIAATIANIDPIFGMKFKKNVSVASKSATSTLKLINIINEINAVKNDVKNLVAMYRVIFDSTSSSII